MAWAKKEDFMKITISDIPLDKAPGIGIPDSISKEQYKELERLGEAFHNNVYMNQNYSLYKEIESFKIEPAYLDSKGEMKYVRFKVAFSLKACLNQKECLLSMKTLDLYALLEIEKHILRYSTKEPSSPFSFPVNEFEKFCLGTDDPMEVAYYLLEALSKSIEQICDSLENETEILKEKARQIRKRA
jgi:hypothetical protein